MTYRALCEKMAEFLAMRGVAVTPEEIWNMSPTGELWPIHELYNLCRDNGMSA